MLDEANDSCQKRKADNNQEGAIAIDLDETKSNIAFEPGRYRYRNLLRTDKIGCCSNRDIDYSNRHQNLLKLRRSVEAMEEDTLERRAHESGDDSSRNHGRDEGNAHFGYQERGRISSDHRECRVGHVREIHEPKRDR
jgi:hypothetical protein